MEPAGQGKRPWQAARPLAWLRHGRRRLDADVDNYLGRVTKTHILQAVREAKGEQSAQLIDHLKKPDMAREAARLLEGSGWLPEVLRLPVDQVQAEAEADAVVSDAVVEDDTAEAGDIDLPTFLTEDEETADAADASIDGDDKHLEAAE